MSQGGRDPIETVGLRKGRDDSPERCTFHQESSHTIAFLSQMFANLRSRRDIY